MASTSNENRVILALQALNRDPKLSARAAAKIYNVPRTTIQRRRDNIPSRRDSTPNLRKLSDLEESTIIQYILDLDARSFPPRLCGVQDMANRLLADRDAPPIGTRWASNFVRRHPELKTRFNRKYDYQRAQCEDPNMIWGWFHLVRNTIAKYGISESDIYNFDETGFMMGVISTGIVVTSAERRGRPRLVQQGNREWVTVIQGINSQGWTIPPFIVVAGQYHLSAWYDDRSLPSDWVIATTHNVGQQTKWAWNGSITLISIQKHDHLVLTDSYCWMDTEVTTQQTLRFSVKKIGSSHYVCRHIHHIFFSHLM